MSPIPCLLFVVLAICIVVCRAVDDKKFRKCSQSSFCTRARGNKQTDASLWTIIPDTVTIDKETARLTASLRNGAIQQNASLFMHVLVNGTVHVVVDEHISYYSESNVHKRYKIKDVVNQSALQRHFPLQDVRIKIGSASLILKRGTALILYYNPLRIELLVDEEVHLVINSRNLFRFESYNRQSEPPAQPTNDDDDEQNKDDVLASDFSEKFGGYTDTRPYGPAAISLDVSFTHASHLFGLPEHTSDFALQHTYGEAKSFDEPYRLYNLDVFEYELNSPSALYGSVPFVIAPTSSITMAMLWLNAAETWVDIGSDNEQEGSGVHTQWIGESGVIELFLFFDEQPKNIYTQYATITGFPSMPPLFAIASHQCRWNYKDESDIKHVSDGFDANNIPNDVLWLDIEHTNGKRYFTWDKSLFPNPDSMLNELAAKGRKMVTIIDPHIKRVNDYEIHVEATKLGYYVKKPDGKTDFEGWCWPGSSSYLDFVWLKVRQFWSTQFAFNKYIGSTRDLWSWIDMNEPSVFSGPEVTMDKHNLHMQGSVEHRDVHNQYGFYNAAATWDGLLQRSNNIERPFLLSRSFFAGSQRYGAIWTGDNMAKWSHLKASLPMLLSLSSAGIPFVGADIGGFFENPSIDLLVRWYAAGALQPFVRAHAHIDAARREPWLFGDEATDDIRIALRLRYQLLAYIYTTFLEASVSGVPVMRPLWLEFASVLSDPALLVEHSQYMLGHALLVAPVLDESSTERSVFLPDGANWYDANTLVQFASQRSVFIQSPRHHVPLFQRSGTIIPKQMRARRNSAAMKFDPYTLVVALDSNMCAEGKLYLDDGHSTAHKLQRAYTLRMFVYEHDTLRGLTADKGDGTYTILNTVERIVIAGEMRRVLNAKLDDKVALIFQQKFNPAVITLRQPNVQIAADFFIQLYFE